MSNGVSPPLRTVVADDHRRFRQFVTQVLADHYADLLTIVAAGPVAELLAACAWHKPALVLLDIGLPGMTSLGLIRALREAGYLGAVLVLSMDDDPPYVAAALAAGAAALLGKATLNTTLRPTIADVLHPPGQRAGEAHSTVS
ncbi:MAG: response regulator transcription factor [Chloroflexales bacterium]|nr:response regulator transcription factor [Chloroflexales bacterium]